MPSAEMIVLDANILIRAIRAPESTGQTHLNCYMREGFGLMGWGDEQSLKHFADLRDPRVERTREHLLEEILLITIAAVLSGANGWNEIEDYAYSKHAWLKSFLTLPSGIPSHDTFNRVFSALDPEELEKGFVAWVSSIAKLTAGEVVAIDGKTLRGASEPSKKGPDKKAIVHMVSAWANSNCWCSVSAVSMKSPMKSLRFLNFSTPWS